nr:trimeric intracellular cation channel family protein [Corynebacterium aquatimens]
MDLIGVFLNAVIGGTVARRMKFDAVGFIVLAIVSAMAGGVIRDAIIGATPVNALRDPWYITIALVGALVAFLANFRGYGWELVRFHGDMIILGVWSTTGAAAALAAGVSYIGCVFMGVLTATGGMVIREVLIGRIPRILNDQQMYVVPAIAGALTAIAINEIGYPTVALLGAPLVAFTLGTVAYWAKWYVPASGDSAPVNTWLRAPFGWLGRTFEPRKFRQWRLAKEAAMQADPRADAGMFPSKGEVRDQLQGPAGADELSAQQWSQEEFIAALYRVYVDESGRGTAGGWARRPAAES